MKILIVEDSDAKFERVSNALGEFNYAGKLIVVRAKSIRSGCEKLQSDKFDLLVLDMVLPLRDDEAPRADGGKLLWEKVCRNGKYTQPDYVVGLTEFPDVMQEIGNKVEFEAWRLLDYDAGKSDWIVQLEALVDHIEQVQMASEGEGPAFDFDVAVVTALDAPELSSILELPYSWQILRTDGDPAVYHVGSFPSPGGGSGKIVAVAASQMGMPAAAVATSRLLANFRPKLVCMTGIAAGVSGKANLGDVIAADPCWDWGSGKYSSDGSQRIFAPDPRQLRASEVVLNLLRQLAGSDDVLRGIRDSFNGDKPDTILKIKWGPFASGSSVIADNRLISEIQSDARKLIAVDMETYGVYYAVANWSQHRPMVIGIKSICDFADEEKNDRFQLYAAHTSARVFQHLIEVILT